MAGGGKSLLIGVLVLAGIYVLVRQEMSKSPSVSPSTPTAINWEPDYQRALTLAAEKNQPILLAFEAVWCMPCKWMENEVFSKPVVANALADWIPVHIDVDKQKELSRKYQIDSMPTFVVLSPTGKEVNRVSGALRIEEFIAFLASTSAKLPPLANSKAG